MNIRYRNRVFAKLSTGGTFVIGRNNGKTHPLQKRFATWAENIERHAEIDALVQWTSRYGTSSLDRAKILVWRERRDDSLGMAKPCRGCQRALAQFGVRSVAYTDDYGKIQELW